MEPYIFDGGHAVDYTDPALVSCVAARMAEPDFDAAEAFHLDFWHVRIFGIVDAGEWLSVDVGIADGPGEDDDYWTDTIQIARVAS